MTEPLAYLNGRFLPASQLTIPVWDIGFVQGVTVAEQIRTFGGQLYRMDLHLERLAESLRLVGIQLDQSQDDLQSTAAELVQRNWHLIEPGDDLGLSLFVTPGPYRSFAPSDARGPTLGMHTYPVAFAGFADKYDRGERLVVSKTRQVPGNCWPPSLKCRSRMHYYLADREARGTDPEARAMLLDQSGYVSEASTANFVVFQHDLGFLSPPRDKILPGVSIHTLEDLARQINVPFLFVDLAVDDVGKMDEAFLCSTSPCLLPVVSLNGRPIGSGQPGPMFRQVIAAWSRLVGLDIVEQAKRFAVRS